MKYLIYAAVMVYALLGAALAQEFETLPNGGTVFTPQPHDYPSPQYYRPEGGPPVGYGVKSGDVQLYVPYQGGPSYVINNHR